MGHFLYPDEYMPSTYQIDFDKLYEQGYRGLIFDIDNTLVPHGAPADERAIRLFAHLKELGFQCVLLSNNKEMRVKMFIKRKSPNRQTTGWQWNVCILTVRIHYLLVIRYLQMSMELI